MVIRGAFVYGARFFTNKQPLDLAKQVAKTASDSCPVCSTCDDSDETPDQTPEQNTNTNENSCVGGFVISSSWLVDLLVLGTVVLSLGVFRRDDRETVAGIYLLALTWSYGRHKTRTTPKP
jgi:hypothetical protein